MAILGESVGEKRVELVRDHVEAENRGDYPAALLTFTHPRYEYVATDEVFDGPDEVMAHWVEQDRAFPDQLIEVLTLYEAEDGVLMEAIARGTHSGPFRGLPPTGRRYELPFSAIFVFEGERLVCERIYMDTSTLMQQLGVARDPLSLTGRLGTVVSHPFKISRGVVRRVVGR
jgi:steroid delta-isomerase-like uncharacterized protein